MIDIIDPNNYFSLGAGTPDERSVPMLQHVSLPDEFDRTFTGMKDLFEGLQNLGERGAPQRIMIQATLLTWCYAATDIAALKQEIVDLKEEYTREVDALGDTVNSLETLIEKQKERLDSMSSRLQSIETTGEVGLP